MRMLARLTVVVTALLVTHVGAAQAQKAASPAREIQPLLDEQLAAANAHDTDRFLASCVHDSTLVLVFNGVVTRGFDQIRALQLKWWNNGKSDVVYGLSSPVQFTVLAPTAVVVTQPMTSSRTDSAGKVMSGGFTVTSVWQKRREGWRIVYSHESTAR